MENSLTATELAALRVQIKHLTDAVSFLETLKPILLHTHTKEYVALCWHLVKLKEYLDSLQSLLNQQ